MNPLSSALFRTPPRSVFKNTFSNQVSYEMGKLVPIKYFDLSPGDRIKLDFSQLTRFAPMLAPVMHNYKLYVDALFVPYRLLWHPLNGVDVKVFNAEKFFRMDSGADGVSLPHYALKQLIRNADYSVLGNLPDYLGYPIYNQMMAKLRDSVLATWWYGIEHDVVSAYYSTQSPYSGNNTIPVMDMLQDVHDAGDRHPLQFTYDGHEFDFTGAEFQDFVVDDVMKSLHDFLLSRGINVPINSYLLHEYSKLQDFLASYDCRLVDFQAYLFERFKVAFLSRIALDANIISDDLVLNLLPYYCYWRAVGDWYLNTNVVDLVTFVEEHLTTPAYSDLLFEPCDVFYPNDYFTGAFDGPQSGHAVHIPVNASVADLRNASALQSLAERVKYAGARLIDQSLARFGVKSRNQSPDRSVVLGREKFDVNITDIMQTSQGDVNSPLASFAGQGYSMSKRDNYVDFQCDEHGMVLVLASLRPSAVYEGQVPRLLYKDSKYDFLNPELASVGEQPIYQEEIFNGFSAHRVFGYQRRYSEYMYEPSEVHGDFRQSLDYWNSARQFATPPALNEDFLRINNKDDFNRIFAVQGVGNHIYSFFYFRSLISRALPRYVNYSL